MMNSNVAFVLLGLVCCVLPLHAAKTDGGLIQRISDLKNFKKFVKTHTNVLVIFAKTERHLANTWQLYSEVALQMKGLASVVSIDCSLDKKLCKKLKSATESVEIKHFKDGEFHKQYDRKMTVKSMTNFLRDPKGDLPWEEDITATDVFHLETRASLTKLLTKESRPILVMFYAPWCGYCKKLKPDYAAAASELKGEAVLAGMDVDRMENAVVRTEFNITGFPTLLYFENGNLKYNYGGENTKDGIVAWIKSPSPPKEREKEVLWSEVESDVVHLTDATFDEFLSNNPSVLVMFYAPWCGHCKKMKPEYEKAASEMRENDIPGTLAAVDATAEREVGSRFEIKGYPTVKYFKDGKEAWGVNERTSDRIVEFMKDPKEPPPPPPAEPSWEEAPGYVIHLVDGTFKTFIKKKKHTLVMFYAPWCGHCKRAKPEFMSAAEKFKDDTKVAFVAVDCTKNSSLCSENDVTGYPTFKYFNYGKNDQKYAGGREESDFVSFMTNPLDPAIAAASVADGRPWSDFVGHENVVQLNEVDFDSVVQKRSLVLVMFYTTWCVHCNAMKPAYVEAATKLKNENVDSVFGAVDMTTEKTLATRFNIKGLPTLKLFRNGQDAFDYQQGRTVDELIAFIKNPDQFAPVKNWEGEPGKVNHLNASNFQNFLNKNKEVLVMFYVPWCVHCKQAKINFWQAAEQLEQVPSGKLLAAMSCIEPQNGDICVATNVRVYPSFKYFRNGEFVTDYKGDRSIEDFVAFSDSSSQSKEEL